MKLPIFMLDGGPVSQLHEFNHKKEDDEEHTENDRFYLNTFPKYITTPVLSQSVFDHNNTSS